MFFGDCSEFVGDQVYRSRHVGGFLAVFLAAGPALHCGVFSVEGVEGVGHLGGILDQLAVVVGFLVEGEGVEGANGPVGE